MKFIVAMLALLTGVVSAAAADLPARTYTKAPVYDPPYDWTGFYIGGNLGYSWGRSRDTSTLTNGAGTVLFTSADSSNLNGFVGGGGAGYNWQMQSWVWGLEADIQGTGESGSRSLTCPIGTCTPTEGAIGGNWTAKLEYLYVDLGRVAGSFATVIGASGGGTVTTAFSSRVTDNVLRVGVNYKFGG